MLIAALSALAFAQEPPPAIPEPAPQSHPALPANVIAAPQLQYRVFAGGGALLGAGTGPTVLAGFHRAGHGERIHALTGGEVLAVPDGSQFLLGLPEGQTVIAVGSDAGARVEPWPMASASPWIEMGIGYTMVLPTFLSGLQGFGAAGVTFDVQPTMAVDVGVESRVLWYFGDPITVIDAQVGVRF